MGLAYVHRLKRIYTPKHSYSIARKETKFGKRFVIKQWRDSHPSNIPEAKRKLLDILYKRHIDLYYRRLAELHGRGQMRLFKDVPEDTALDDRIDEVEVFQNHPLQGKLDFAIADIRKTEMTEGRKDYLKQLRANHRAVGPNNYEKKMKKLYEFFLRQVPRTKDSLYLQTIYRNRRRVAKAEPAELDGVLRRLWSRRVISNFCSSFEINPEEGYGYVKERLAKDCPSERLKEQYKSGKEKAASSMNSVISTISERRKKRPKKKTSAEAPAGEINLTSVLRFYKSRKKKKSKRSS